MSKKETKFTQDLEAMTKSSKNYRISKYKGKIQVDYESEGNSKRKNKDKKNPRKPK